MNTKKQTAYDEIKGMLSTMRTLNESKVSKTTSILTEDVAPTEPGDDIPTPESSQEKYDNVEVVNEVEVKLISTDQEDVKLKDNEKGSISQLIDSFRQQVAQLTDLNPGFTIDESQIRLDGSIPDLDVNFVMIAGEDGGLYINSDMLSIEDETLVILEKLSKFKPTFITAMEPILRDRRTT
jgi:hypothetical protein